MTNFLSRIKSDGGRAPSPEYHCIILAGDRNKAAYTLAGIYIRYFDLRVPSWLDLDADAYPEYNSGLVYEELLTQHLNEVGEESRHKNTVDITECHGTLDPESTAVIVVVTPYLYEVGALHPGAFEQQSSYVYAHSEVNYHRVIAAALRNVRDLRPVLFLKEGCFLDKIKDCTSLLQVKDDVNNNFANRHIKCVNLNGSISEWAAVFEVEILVRTALFYYDFQAMPDSLVIGKSQLCNSELLGRP